MKHRLTVLVGACVVMSALLWPVAGQAGTPGSEACQIAGSASIYPYLTAKPTADKVSFSGRLTNCHGSNSKITSGSITGSAKGTGSCEAGADTTLTAKIAWSNSTYSYISGKLTSVTGLAQVAGTVTSGAFAGMPVAGSVVFQPSSGPTGAKACAGSGISTVTYQGAVY